MTTESEDMSLEKALEVIKQIAERFERISKCAAVAERIDRDRADAIQAATSESGRSGGADAL